MDAILMHPGDNVALAVADLPAGHVIEVGGHRLALPGPIPAGHKFALESIRACDIVYKYGQPIGRATQDIPAGGHAHVHNVESLRGRGDLPAGSESVSAGDLRSDLSAVSLPEPLDPVALGLPGTFMGYRRKDGRVGVRNHVLVLATVQCANAVVDRIGQAVPGVVSLSHVWGCSQIGDDLTQTRRVLEEFAGHPNVGAVLLISLGCESLPAAEMAEKLAASGVLCRLLTIQEEGGSRATLARGQAIAQELLQQVAGARREPVPVSELVLGVECGGSDAFSGVTANPATGVASDLLVAAGGTVILSEVPEFIGAEHLLAARAASPEIARQIGEAVARAEAGATRMGVDLRGAQPTPGNIAGGLTTIEEKSLGAIEKGGASIVRQYVPYAHRPATSGLVVMDTPGNDPESVTGMVAGGAQIVVFTTGRGSPTGCPIAPVIKVASNSPMYRRLRDDMDIDAGTVIEEGEPLSSAGRRIFDEVCVVAEGKQTAAEEWGHKEFAINVIGPRL
jgi:altronate dehydratase large subunit